jgi:hypothetical protein
VRPLVDVLQAGRSPAVHAAAASALESLALDRNNRQAIAAAGGVPALTAILASGDDGSRVAAGKVGPHYQTAFRQLHVNSTIRPTLPSHSIGSFGFFQCCYTRPCSSRGFCVQL